MGVDGQEGASAERVHELLKHLELIMPRLTMMAPEMREQLMKQVGQGHPRFSPRLVAGPPTMHRMVGMLYRDPKPTMSDLGKELSLPLSTVSRIVDMLEERGFAKRQPDPEDGRIIRVGLTDTGRQIHEAMLSHGVRNAQRVLDCLTPEEQIILLTLLGKVAANLRPGEG